MKRVFALVLTLATALGLAACNSGGGESGENVVRIGIFEPATGDNGAGGKQEMLGMQYANKETPTVDIGGTTYNVELVYADNGSDYRQGAHRRGGAGEQGCQPWCWVPTVPAWLWPAVRCLTRRAWPPSASPAPIPNITAGNDYYFRICFLDQLPGHRCW